MVLVEDRRIAADRAVEPVLNLAVRFRAPDDAPACEQPPGIRIHHENRFAERVQQDRVRGFRTHSPDRKQGVTVRRPHEAVSLEERCEAGELARLDVVRARRPHEPGDGARPEPGDVRGQADAGVAHHAQRPLGVRPRRVLREHRPEGNLEPASPVVRRSEVTGVVAAVVESASTGARRQRPPALGAVRREQLAVQRSEERPDAAHQRVRAAAARPVSPAASTRRSRTARAGGNQSPQRVYRVVRPSTAATSATITASS